MFGKEAIVLTTKLYIPSLRPRFVARPRLWQQLDKGLKRKLTLISAPAGFGKTLLLSGWSRQCSLPVAWLSLDEQDDSSAGFWSYVIYALQQVDEAIGQASLQRLRSPERLEIHLLLNQLLNEIGRRQAPLILIIDDYHLLNSASLHQEMAYFLDHLPEQMHLYVATRSDPPFPLSRYRGRGELLELRTADLRFSTQETAAFLTESMKLDLDGEAIATLDARTEGWVTGLQMAALSLQGRSPAEVTTFITSFSGSHRFVLDFLVDEVLGNQAEAIQAFLLRTAVLERLTTPLCDALLQSNNSGSILERLEVDNVFLIALDENRQWYRYHHLFADLLRERLLHFHPQEIQPLHLQAALWYEDAGYAQEAIHHALSSDMTLAADLIERHILPAIYRSEFSVADRWLAALPSEVIAASPTLLVAQAWFAARCASLEQSEKYIDGAKNALASGHPAADDLISGHIGILQTILSRTRGETALQQLNLAEKILQSIPENALGMRSMLAFRIGLGHLDLGDEEKAEMYCRQATRLGEQDQNFYAALGAVYVRAVMAKRRGQLAETETICLEALANLSPEEKELPMVGVIFITLGSVFVERDQLGKAEKLFRQGLALSESGGFTEANVKGMFNRARVQLCRGRLEEVPDLNNYVRTATPALQKFAAACQARLHLLAFGRSRDKTHLNAAAVWADKQQFQVENAPEADWRILAHIIHAQVLLARCHFGQVNLASALDYLKTQEPLVTQLGWGEILLRLLLVKAPIEEALGQGAAARQTIAQALALAGSSGYLRLFIEDAPNLAGLIYQALESGGSPHFAAELLKVIGEDLPLEEQEHGLIEPLTPREIEVLQLIAAGSTNREIGQQLSISLGTVKRHTANINGKLDVHNRVQAVARARALGILTD